jgi:16S rRNA (cytosine1402-N4)-methyltransferase
MDVDPQALQIARKRLAPFGARAVVVQASYATLSAQLEALDWPLVDGVLLDLGASSMQFDTAERGFSFQAEAPLDMRFDPANPVRAADLVNKLPEAELADILRSYGEEPQARRIAAAIVRARPLNNTLELAEVVANAAGRRDRRTGNRLHPATLTFQALRIAVNGELQALEAVLPQANLALAPGGRLAVISFHSLEDRLVKQYLRRESQDCLCPPRQPVCTCGHHATLRVITRRPLTASLEETRQNPRARSARLRVAEKIGSER